VQRGRLTKFMLTLLPLLVTIVAGGFTTAFPIETSCVQGSFFDDDCVPGEEVNQVVMDELEIIF
jgi:hypothetical protein